MNGPMTSGATPQTAQTARVLHAALLGGLLAISAVFLVLAFGAHAAPLIVARTTTVTIGYLLAGCAMISIVTGVGVLKPRVPPRTSGQDDAAFWLVALGPVMSVWAIVEGAGIMAAVGALLTGLLAPAIVVVIALGCLVMFRPGYFESA